MSGHYEYSDWLGDNVWVEDPPAAKVAPVVAAGLPALAATQPAPVAAAPIAPVVATPVAPVTPVTSAPAAFDPKGNLDAATLAALQDAYAKQGVGGMQDIGGYDSNGQQQFVPTTVNGFQINANLIANPNYVPQGADNSSPQSETMQGTNVASYSKQVGDNVYVYDTKGNLTSVVPTGGRWGGAIDMIKFLGPAILSGGLGGAAGAGSAMGLGTGTAATIGGGAALGAGTAALTGGDILKGALLGGLGGASNVGIGDTGATVGQVTSGVNLVKNLESGNLFGAITGAANIAGAGNTQIGETGLTINDLSKDVNLAKAVISGNPQALMGALTSVASSATNSSNDANNLINQYTQTGAGTGAATPDYPTNDLGFQQILGEFSNPKDLSGNASVNVASNDNASALAALEDAKTAAKIDSGQTVDLGEVSNNPPETELPPGLNFPGDQSTPTEAQQQQAISNLHDALAETQQPETPAETPITNPDALIGNLQDAGLTNDFISRNTPILGIGDPTDQISNPPPISAEERALLAPQAPVTNSDALIAELQDAGLTNEQIGIPTPPSAPAEAAQPETPVTRSIAPAPAETPAPIQDIIAELQNAGLTNAEIKNLVPEAEQFIAPEPAPETKAAEVAPETPVTVPTQAEQQPAVENFIKQIEQYQAPEPTVEQILASEPPPAGVPAETPTPEVTPEVQALIDQAVTGQQESAQAGQPAIDQQTQQLLSDLSGGTDTGVTPTDVSNPVFKAEPDAAGTDAEFYKMIGIDPTTIDPFKNVEGELDPSDLAINRANKIDQSNQQGNEWDNASTGDDLFTTEPPPEETPIDQIDITRKLPTDDSEPGWEGWTPPPTPIDYSGISDILSGGQTEPSSIDYSGISDILSGGQSETPPEETPPEETLPPAFSIPRIPSAPATKTPAAAPAKTVAPAAKKAAVTQAAALASAIAQGYMPSVGDVAHIKSLESLFGPILGTLLAEQTNEKKDDSLSALEGMDQEYASGGHVDDFSVEALLHILRS